MKHTNKTQKGEIKMTWNDLEEFIKNNNISGEAEIAIEIDGYCLSADCVKVSKDTEAACPEEASYMTPEDADYYSDDEVRYLCICSSM